MPDNANISALFAGQAVLMDEMEERLLVMDIHWRQLNDMPDTAVRMALLPRIEPGRACAITNFPNGESHWEQNGPEFPDIVATYRNTFAKDPSPDVEIDLRILEVALNEGATLITDDRDLQKLVELLDGCFAESAKLLSRVA